MGWPPGPRRRHGCGAPTPRPACAARRRSLRKAPRARPLARRRGRQPELQRHSVGHSVRARHGTRRDDASSQGRDTPPPERARPTARASGVITTCAPGGDSAGTKIAAFNSVRSTQAMKPARSIGVPSAARIQGAGSRRRSRPSRSAPSTCRPAASPASPAISSGSAATSARVESSQPHQRRRAGQAQGRRAIGPEICQRACVARRAGRATWATAGPLAAPGVFQCGGRCGRVRARPTSSPRPGCRARPRAAARSRQAISAGRGPGGGQGPAGLVRQGHAGCVRAGRAHAAHQRGDPPPSARPAPGRRPRLRARKPQPLLPRLRASRRAGAGVRASRSVRERRLDGRIGVQAQHGIVQSLARPAASSRSDKGIASRPGPGRPGPASAASTAVGRGRCRFGGPLHRQAGQAPLQRRPGPPAGGVPRVQRPRHPARASGGCSGAAPRQSLGRVDQCVDGRGEGARLAFAPVGHECLFAQQHRRHHEAVGDTVARQRPGSAACASAGPSASARVLGVSTRGCQPSTAGEGGTRPGQQCRMRQQQRGFTQRDGPERPTIGSLRRPAKARSCRRSDAGNGAAAELSPSLRSSPKEPALQARGVLVSESLCLSTPMSPSAEPLRKPR